jgi:N-acylglucosamine-6-phosphate 2-epimerase
MIDLDTLRGGLVASCQPVAGSPMDRTDIITAMARSAESGGASAVRIEGVENVAAVRSVINVPVIGIVKYVSTSSPVCITPRIADAQALVRAGADIVAFDATSRVRDEPLEPIIDYLHTQDVALMADCSSVLDVRRVLALGVHIVGTTLSGYTTDTKHLCDEPDLEFVRQCAQLTSNLQVLVMAEGRFNSPEQAREALLAGADCVTVGSAITRIEPIVGWFTDAMTRR